MADLLHFLHVARNPNKKSFAKKSLLQKWRDRLNGWRLKKLIERVRRKGNNVQCTFQTAPLPTHKSRLKDSRWQKDFIRRKCSARRKNYSILSYLPQIIPIKWYKKPLKPNQMLWQNLCHRLIQNAFETEPELSSHGNCKRNALNADASVSESVTVSVSVSVSTSGTASFAYEYTAWLFWFLCVWCIWLKGVFVKWEFAFGRPLPLFWQTFAFLLQTSNRFYCFLNRLGLHINYERMLLMSPVAMQDLYLYLHT